MDAKDQAIDVLDFQEKQAQSDCVVRLEIPREGTLEKIRTPASYLLAACHAHFAAELLHSFTHERLIVLICSDAAAASRVRTFAEHTLERMSNSTRTFRFRLNGVSALNKDLVSELISKIGDPQSLEMHGARSDHFGNHAFFTLRQPATWRWPRTLPFKAYGLKFEAQLSLAPESREQVGYRGQQPSSAADDGQEMDGQRVLERKPRVEACRDFARGACTRGDNCIFRHTREA